MIPMHCPVGPVRSRLAPAAAALALLVVTPACTATDESPEGTPEPAGAAGSPSSSPGSRTSVLDDYLGAGRAEDTVTDDAAAYRLYSEAIARCMAAEGFEYVPDSSQWTTEQIGDRQLERRIAPSRFPDLPPDEFAARFGYGHSTAPKQDRNDDPVDRNEEIVAAMSIAERVAYYGALYGPRTPLDDQGHLESTIESTDDSCSAQADRSIPTDKERESTERRVQRVRTSHASLLGRIADLRDQVLVDPRVVAATQEWSGCLAAAGFDGLDDIESAREKSLVDARALLGHDLDSSGVDPGRLATLRANEIRLAVADHECRVAWDAVFLRVQRDLEEDFVKANLTELEGFRTAMSAARR